MASPDRIRNSQLFLLISAIPLYVWVKKTMPHAMTTTTTVQMAVARFELTPSIPILAKIEVSAANTADNSANTIHIAITCNCVFQTHRRRSRITGRDETDHHRIAGTRRRSHFSNIGFTAARTAYGNTGRHCLLPGGQLDGYIGLTEAAAGENPWRPCRTARRRRSRGPGCGRYTALSARSRA